MTERDEHRLRMLGIQVRAATEYYATHETVASEVLQRKAIEDMAFLLGIINGLMTEAQEYRQQGQA